MKNLPINLLKPSLPGASFGLGRRYMAFTLIELLVVISVIAIMVAMLIPVIGIIRFSANGMVCVNRQKQTVVGILTYANDNDNEMPYISLPISYYQGKQLNGEGFSCSTSVNGMIFQYVETMRIALCPSNKNKHPVNDVTWGSHQLPCPYPENCQGRSNVYGAWTGNDIDPTTYIMDASHGCTISQYKARMKKSYFNSGGTSVNRFTGLLSTGAIPAFNTWSDVWGTTLLIEMWPGQHKSGMRRGSALVNIDGAGLFRTYTDSEIISAPFRQVKRYEQE